MFNLKFWKKQKPVIDTEPQDLLINRIASAIDASSNQLKTATESMSTQAIETANWFKTKLELYEQKFSIIIDDVDDVIIVKTVNHQWVSVNRFACQILHIDRDIVLGKNNGELSEIYPNLKEILDKLEFAEKQAIHQHKSSNFHIEIQDRGRKMYLYITVTPIDNHDQSVQEVLIVGHNNTKLYKQMQMHASASDVLNAFSDPIIVVDSSQKITFVNLAFQKEFEIDYHGVVGSFFGDFIPSEATEIISKLIELNIDVKKTVEFANFDIRITPILNEHIYAPVYTMLKFVKKDSLT